MTFGSSFREVRKNEGVRNRDSTVVNICLVVEKKNVFLSHMIANGIVRSIEESSSDAEFKENSSQKVCKSL